MQTQKTMFFFIFQFLVDPYSSVPEQENVQVFNPLSQDSDVSILLCEYHWCYIVK